MTGPAGSDGAVGPPGPAGPAGPIGGTGPAGPAGADGEVGAAGPPGVDGADGADGLPGETGPAGEAGPAGPQGPVGPAGPAGATGPIGPAGPQGPAGADGVSLPAGVDAGDLLYWNGTAWVLTPAPPDGLAVPAVLSLVDGVPTWRPTRFEVGGPGPAGGIVIAVDADGLHGLEAAPVDLAGAPWGCPSAGVVGADGVDIGTGRQNTDDIVLQCGSGTAAALADAYALNGHEDWFLPSRDELHLMSGLAGLGLGDFLGGYYWSSSVGTGTVVLDAYREYLAIGVVDASARSGHYAVRPIRAF